MHGESPYMPLPSVLGLSFANVYSSQDSATVAYLPFWPLVTGVIYAIYMLVGLDNRFAYYFLLKQPIIAGDVVLAYLLYSYISSRTSGEGTSVWAVRLWALSPFTIILSGVWGMFDSLCMCFILVSIMTTDYVKRSLWMGIGIFAKSLTLIFAIPAAIRKTQRVIGLLVAIGFPAFTSLITMIVMGWSLPTVMRVLASTVVRGGGSMSVWDALYYMNYLGVLQTLPSNLANVLGFLWVPAIILFTVLAYRKMGFDSDHGLVQSMLIIILVFLIFKARVTEQYAIYLLALAVIDVAIWNPQRKRMLMATIGTVLFYLFLNNYFLIRFLSPVYPDYVKIETGLSQIEPIRLALLFAAGIVFTCLNLSYLISILKENRSFVENKELPRSFEERMTSSLGLARSEVRAAS
jgi:hypothetical protein